MWEHRQKFETTGWKRRIRRHYQLFLKNGHLWARIGQNWPSGNSEPPTDKNVIKSMSGSPQRWNNEANWLGTTPKLLARRQGRRCGQGPGSTWASEDAGASEVCRRRFVESFVWRCAGVCQKWVFFRNIEVIDGKPPNTKYGPSKGNLIAKVPLHHLK